MLAAFWRKSDKAVRIGLFFCLGWLVTLIGLGFFHGQICGTGRNFFPDVFTAWLGELVFFTVVGLAATIISIEKPEDPHTKAFEERLKILFGNKLPQAVLEHNRTTLRLNARYSSDGSRKIYVKEYKADYNAYRVIAKNTYFMKSAIADFDWTEEIVMEIQPDPIANLKSEDRLGAIIHIEINGVEKVLEPTPINAGGYKFNWKETSAADRAVEVKTEHEILMVCECEQSQTATRFAESITVEFFNECQDGVTVSFMDKPGARVPLVFNNNKGFSVDKKCVEPGDLIVSFKLHAPVSNKGQPHEKAGPADGSALQSLVELTTPGAAGQA